MVSGGFRRVGLRWDGWYRSWEGGGEMRTGKMAVGEGGYTERGAFDGFYEVEVSRVILQQDRIRES